VDGWIAAAQLKLEPIDLTQIARALQETGAGTGPAHPVGALVRDWSRGAVASR
jgi:hypothetical protein